MQYDININSPGGRAGQAGQGGASGTGGLGGQGGAKYQLLKYSIIAIFSNRNVGLYIYIYIYIYILPLWRVQ